MAINLQAAQLVVGAALLDARFRRTLIEDRSRALREVEQQPSAPKHVRMTEDDRLALASIKARSLAEFALGVERLRLGSRSLVGGGAASAARVSAAG
jgi:hypothetical protein